jgi:hypothetical protein
MIASYVRNDNNNVVMLLGSRNSFKCRQREYKNDIPLKDTKESLRFISFKESQKIIHKNNKIIYGPLIFDTLSRL